MRSRAITVLATAIALLFLLPFYWAIVASLREVGAPPPDTIEWFPKEPHWENYGALYDLLPMVRYSVNSLIVVAVAVPVTVLVSSWAGFGLAQYEGRGRGWLIWGSVALMIVPAAAIWLFRVQIFKVVGVFDSLWALIVPAFAGSSPLYVLLFFWTFRRVSAEMFEAGRLDGVSGLRAWWSLAMPLARPVTVAVAVLSFILYWNDFMSPVLYIFEPEGYTLAVGVQLVKQYDQTNWPLMMAAAVYMSMPVILVFMSLQRYFLRDLTLGDVD